MESVVVFGEKKNLVGILNHAKDPDSANRPIIVILNAGLVCRSGPFRMSTEMARELSQIGFHSFRFDLSEIGDSNKDKHQNQSVNERYLSDIGQALAELEKKLSSKSFIVLGLCNGADLAHQASVQFNQVKGYVSLDGYGYKNFNAHFQRFLPIVTHPQRLFQAIKRKLRRAFSASQAKHESHVEQDFNWKLPPKKSYIADMQLMHKKELKQLLIFTGAVRGYYSYQNQFIDVFGKYAFSNNVEVSYFETADHTYLLSQHRNILFERINVWLKRHFN